MWSWIEFNVTERHYGQYQDQHQGVETVRQGAKPCHCQPALEICRSIRLHQTNPNPRSRSWKDYALVLKLRSEINGSLLWLDQDHNNLRNSQHCRLQDADYLHSVNRCWSNVSFDQVRLWERQAAVCHQFGPRAGRKGRSVDQEIKSRRKLGFVD